MPSKVYESGEELNADDDDDITEDEGDDDDEDVDEDLEEDGGDEDADDDSDVRDDFLVGKIEGLVFQSKACCMGNCLSRFMCLFWF